MSRLKIIISAVEDNLSKATPKNDSLHMDRGDMEKLLDEICDKVARLIVIQYTQLQDDVEVIIESAYNTLRNANLCLWSKQNPKVAVTLLNDNLSATNTESISSTMTTSVVSHTQTQASSSTSMPVDFRCNHIGNIEKSYSTCEYQFTIRTRTGKKVTVNAFGMERITGPVSKLDPDVLVQLFPDYDPQSLQRKSSTSMCYSGVIISDFIRRKKKHSLVRI